MARASAKRVRHEAEEESYFISMSDMMVGLLFIFIILVLYFALQFRKTTVELTSADQSRSQILHAIEQRLRDKGLKVTIDEKAGVLRLPDQILFAKGDAALSPHGRDAVGILAQAMAAVLSCYALGLPRPADCPPELHHLDAVFIEGHTDIDPMRRGDNWDLSVARATNTYRTLVELGPELPRLTGPMGQAILSVSGYGPNRPVDRGDSEAAKAKNRRIDLRFLMATPRTPGGGGS